MRRIAGVTAVVALFLAMIGVALLLRLAHSSPWPPPPSSDPGALVGSWQVMGDPAIDGRKVRLHAGGRVSLRDGACVLTGGWSATTSGLMIMNIDAATNECRDLADAFDYFAGVQRYELMADAVRLDNLSGSTVAVLSDRVPPNGLEETYAPREAAPDLPGEVRPPSFELLTAGRWIPVETVDSDRWPEKDRPHAEFDTDGTWHGSDGCNGLGGRWSIDTETGEWLAGTLGQTDIGCDNVDVSGMVAPPRAVGIDGDELVFYAADGAETGRFAAEG